MKTPKYIENINLPLRLGWQEHPKFLVYKWEKEGENYRLHYLIDERGISVPFHDKEKFDRFPHLFEVESGGWYGDDGRWSPIERYMGTIICENVKSFKELSSQGENFKFNATKSILSPYKVLIIESEKVGKLEIKCKRIVPNEYDSFYFSKVENKWVSSSYVIENLDSYLNDTTF